MERKQLNKEHPQTGDHRRRNRSGYRKKVAKQGHLLPGDHRGRNKSECKKNIL
jgi:hypothetical protein